jgi:hypothetical protein
MISPAGFSLTTRGGVGELGPFVEKTNLLTWLEEMALRLGPSAAMCANQFPNADPRLIQLFREIGTELVRGFSKPSRQSEAASPPTG